MVELPKSSQVSIQPERSIPLTSDLNISTVELSTRRTLPLKLGVVAVVIISAPPAKPLEPDEPEVPGAPEEPEVPEDPLVPGVS